MTNISLNMEPLELNYGETYLIIDAIYLNEIREANLIVNSQDLLEIIRKEVFPHTDTPFSEYKALQSYFDVNKIKKIESTNVPIDKQSWFSTDTGLLVLVNVQILSQIIVGFSYNKLVDTPFDL